MVPKVFWKEVPEDGICQREGWITGHLAFWRQKPTYPMSRPPSSPPGSSANLCVPPPGPVIGSLGSLFWFPSN